MAEWLIAPVLKTGVGETPPGVRIPPSPPETIGMGMGELSDYYSVQISNRQVFDKNFPSDITEFNALLSRLQEIWARVGTVRGLSGQSHAGLLPFANLLLRHFIFGFEHLSCYQSFLAWLTFRPGLESLLIIGKFVDDPANAKIWLDREVNPGAYRQVFSGTALESRSLPKSAQFRQVLSRLNDQFMHPNPAFTYRESSVATTSDGPIIGVQFFDVTADLHEAHLLAYMNLTDIIVTSCNDLVNSICGATGIASQTQSYGSRGLQRAAQFSKEPTAKKVLQDLGLWIL